MEHLKPAIRLYLIEVLTWRFNLEVASCRLPKNTLEHIEHLTAESVGMLEPGEVGEIEV